MFLKQNTAVDIKMGPFVDDADGDTPQTALTLDVEVSKDGGALVNKNEGTTPTHDAAGDVDGYYLVKLDVTDTGTLGILKVVAHHADALPVWETFMVVHASFYEAMDGTTPMQKAIKTNTALDNIEFMMVDSNDDPVAGLSPTGTKSIDGAGFVAVTGTINNVANGIYQFDASAADLNGSIITFRFTDASADDTFITVRTNT